MTAPEPDPGERFRAIIRARLDELDLSAHEASKRAGISYEGLLKILRGGFGSGVTRRPRAQTMTGLSRALQVPEARLYEALEMEQPEPWVLPEKAHRTTKYERAQVERIISMIVDNREAHLR